MIPELKYIKDKITIKTIRDAILDLGITENDTILLNQTIFDNIVLEYRDIYKKSISIPYLLLSVLIKEDYSLTVPNDRIGLIRNDSKSPRTTPKIEDEFSDWEVAYRCGWCGNILDEQGRVLDGLERARTIRYIEYYPNPTIRKKNGKCCPTSHQ